MRRSGSRRSWMALSGIALQQRRELGAFGRAGEREAQRLPQRLALARRWRPSPRSTMASRLPPAGARRRPPRGRTAARPRARAPARSRRAPAAAPNTTSRQRATSSGSSTFGRIAAMNARRALGVDVARRLGGQPALAVLERHVVRHFALPDIELRFLEARRRAAEMFDGESARHARRASSTPFSPLEWPSRNRWFAERRG